MNIMASESTVLRPLGTEGRHYFTEHWELANGLSGSLLKAKPFETGSVFASVPEETTEAQSKEFESGWLHRSSDVGQVYRLMSDALKGLGPTALLVAEDFLRRCSDPYLPNLDRETQFCIDGQLVTYGDQQLSADDVGLILSATDCDRWHHAAVVEPSVSLDLPTGRAVISDELVGPLMAHPKAALARAYDGQGYVVWIADSIDVHTKVTLWAEDTGEPSAPSSVPTTVDLEPGPESDTLVTAPLFGATTPGFVKGISDLFRAAIDALRF